MDYSNRNIVINELIGLKVKVIDSLDKKQKGISGLVIDETKNTLRVFDGKGVKSIVSV
ncbi:MAG: ribonuclease P protein subunit [Candidatus Marsarchaeota archaeon]|nr:ribonuclease P protein subunit [Candidatus Marsarchaeota archaeon]